jgi:hypothetical protein
MPYLFKVMRESMRYRPPVPFVARRVAEDVTLGDYFIPKDVRPSLPLPLPLSLSPPFLSLPSSPLLFCFQTQVVINIYHQHHNSPVWVNPEKFDPERYKSKEWGEYKGVQNKKTKGEKRSERKAKGKRNSKFEIRNSKIKNRKLKIEIRKTKS